MSVSQLVYANVRLGHAASARYILITGQTQTTTHSVMFQSDKERHFKLQANSKASGPLRTKSLKFGKVTTEAHSLFFLELSRFGQLGEWLLLGLTARLDPALPQL